MPHEQDHGTGLRLVPEPTRARSIGPLLALASDENLPEQYVVPMIRHWFDADFKPVPSKVWTLPDGSPLVVNQAWLDRCVGEAFALQKTSHEGEQISALDTWFLTKKIDEAQGYPLEAYGASAWAGAEAIAAGAASEKACPSPIAGKTRAKMLDGSHITTAVLEDRKLHKGRTPYFVPRDMIRRTLIQTEHPVPTSCRWYSADNEIGRNGADPRMGPASGSDAGGHMFTIAGWMRWQGQTCLLVLNSWSKDWGWYGMFLIPLAGAFNRLGNGYVHVDIEPSVAELLAKYDGKDVRLGPDHYRCELGVIRKYPNELVWFTWLKKFGYDTFDITAAELAAIPRGSDMPLGPYAEFIRQTLQHYGIKT